MKTMKKALALVVCLALVLTVMLPCFTFVSLAEDTVYTYNPGGSAFATDFSYYKAESLNATKLVSSTFADHFDDYGNVLIQKVKLSDGGDYQARELTMLHNTKMRDFELTMRVNNSKSTSPDYLYNAGPSIMFGVQDPTAWRALGYGFEAYLWGSGGGFAMIANYTYEDTAWDNRIDDSAHSESSFPGFNNDLYVRLRVEDSTATISWGYASNGTDGIGDAVSIALPDTYKGGYVGLAFPSEAIRVWSLSITDLGGEVEEVAKPMDKASYTWDTASLTTFRSIYQVYNGTDPETNGLDPITWDEAISSGRVESTGFGVVRTSDMVYTNSSTEKNKYITTMINTSKKYRDFEMKFKVNSRTGSLYIFPAIMFGVNQPENWATPNAGWAAGLAQNGNVVMPSIYGYDAATEAYKEWTPDTFNGAGFYGLYWYWLTVRVEGDTVTVSYEQPDSGSTGTYTFETPSTYTGGYVGLMFRGDSHTSWQLTFEELGGEVVEPEYEAPITPDEEGGEVIDPEEPDEDPEIVSQTVYSSWSAANVAEFKTDYQIYNGTDPLENGFDSMTWDDAKAAGRVDIDSGFNVYKTSDMVYGDVGTEYNKYLTTMINTSKKYRNFQLRFKVLGKSGATHHYPAIMFGVNQPENWGTPNAGWAAGWIQNGSSDVKPAIQGYNPATEGFYTWAPDSYASADYSSNSRTFYGASHWYWLDLKVVGNYATLTINQPDYAGEFVYKFEVPSTYTGGYVGLLFRGQQYYSWAYELYDLGGEVVEPEYEAPVVPGESSKYDSATYSWDAAACTAFKSIYEVFNGVKPLQNGMQAMTWDDAAASGRLSVGTNNGAGFSAAKTSDMVYTQTSLQYNDYLTTIINTSKKYRDFHMRFKVLGRDGAQYQYPAIMFGVQDPTKWGTPSAGWAAGMIQNVNDVKPAVQGYNAKTDGFYTWGPAEYATAEHTSTGRTFYGALHWYWLDVKVDGDNITITIDQPDYAGEFSYTMEVPAEYQGGYVGILLRGQAYTSWQLTFEELGGEVVESDVTEINATSVADSNVTVPVATFGKDLILPSTVAVTAENGKTYDMLVSWDISNYDRFTVGTYECVGTFNGSMVEDGAYLFPAGKTAKLYITVEGDEDVEPITISCVGDSITYGDGVGTAYSYPSRLQYLLGGKYIVNNYGVCGATVSSTAAPNYRQYAQYTNSLATDTDIVMIMMGTNDAWDAYWGVGRPDGVTAEEHFASEYADLVDSYIKALPNARIILATPATYYGSEGRNEKFESIIASIYEIAEARDLEVLDINTVTAGKKDWFPDGVHPNVTGYYCIADAFAKQILGTQAAIGDPDNDGDYDANDDAYFTKLLFEVPGYHNDMYDVNGDGKIDVIDIIHIKKFSK